ncbi:helix-turn-helix domain-containing protein [Streptomyces sp. NPDC049585]|uniref:helix-turn-helix domain-containing protein n=1 Tax=Streptomyces sp. NPDC049585 TaxID=3155154 RepID=UPI003443E0A4
MPRWKELPASLDQRVRQLLVRLRRLKDRSGLSLAALAAKTSYSRSSWERYLNGRQLPPREAVEELARACGTDPTRLLVLHELAADAWSGEPAVADPQEDDSDLYVRDGRRPVIWALTAAVVVLAAALVATLLATRPWQDEAKPAPAAGDTPAPFVFVEGRERACAVKRVGGELRAGYSTTHDKLMDLKSSGWEVLEAQCLLKYHGFDPGIADGSYGERSKRAAKDFQKSRRLVVDGVIGPDTWGELRR